MKNPTSADSNLFYFVQPGDSLTRVLHNVYGNLSSKKDHETLQKVVLMNNPQLASAGLSPNQCIDVSPFINPPLIRNAWCNDSLRMSKVWATMPKENKELASSEPELTSKILKWTGVLIGYGAAQQDATEKQLKYINKLVQAKGEQISQLARARMANAGRGIGDQIRSQQALREIEEALKTAVKNLTGFAKQDVTSQIRKAPPLIGTNLNRVQKSLIRIPVPIRNQFNAFTPYLEKVAKIGKRAGKFGKIGSIGIPLSIAAYEVNKHWDTPNRNKALVKNSASVGAGLAGGWLGFTACTLIFFGPTGGTSVFWCGIVAGGTTGFLASEVAEYAVDSYYAAPGAVTPLALSDMCMIPRG